MLPVDPLADEPAFLDDYVDDLRAGADIDDYAPGYADDLDPAALAAPDVEL